MDQLRPQPPAPDQYYIPLADVLPDRGCPIYGHPRNLYARVDALRSHRHIIIELGCATLADTTASVMLFESGLPTGYYIDRTDVATAHLGPSSTETLCPCKGVMPGR